MWHGKQKMRIWKIFYILMTRETLRIILPANLGLGIYFKLHPSAWVDIAAGYRKVFDSRGNESLGGDISLSLWPNRHCISSWLQVNGLHERSQGILEPEGNA